jgi:hypothetical protein
MKKVLIVILLLAFVSCARVPNPGSVPPGVQVANLSRALAETLRTSNQSIQVLRDQARITPAETRIIQNYLVIAAGAGKQMDAELMSADPWAVQSQKIIQIWTATSIGVARDHLGADAKEILNTIIVVVNQVMAIIGGPSI